MICARCLYLDRPLYPEQGPAVAGAAITVANGQALCLDHWRELRELPQLHADLDG